MKFMAIHPFLIRKEHLEPKHENPLLDSLIPPQTYLQLGSNKLDIDIDINLKKSVLLIEHD